MPITNWDIVIRLVLITVIAGLVGLEREYHAKPAGLRTNVMVGLGSTLMTIASIAVLQLYPGSVSADPMRLASQIITGIGFIGAGAILRQVSHGNNVIGLTTAATLWVVAGLGIAVGMGLYFAAIATTVMVYFTFIVLGKLVNYVRHHSKAYQRDSSAVINE